MFGLFLMGLLGFGIVFAIVDDANDSDSDSDTAAAPVPAGELIDGTEGADEIVAGDGNDSIFAQGGDDSVMAGGGDDRVFADDGDDVVLGNAGNDFLRGGADDDVILPGAGMDTVFGDVGDDLILGADLIDEDALLALAQSETVTEEDLKAIFGLDNETGEADTLDGGVGDDMILFGSDDEVTGGSGADDFVTGDWISPGAPATITDFDPVHDVLSFAVHGNAFPFIVFSEEDDGTAVLQVDGETVVYLPGVDFTTLDASHLFLIGIPLPGQI